MARIYLSKEDTPIGDPVGSYLEGRKFRNDELYQNALKGVQKAELDMKFGKFGGQITPEYDKDNVYTGYKAESPDSPTVKGIDATIEKINPGVMKRIIDAGRPAMPKPPLDTTSAWSGMAPKAQQAPQIKPVLNESGAPLYESPQAQSEIEARTAELNEKNKMLEQQMAQQKAPLAGMQSYSPGGSVPQQPQRLLYNPNEQKPGDVLKQGTPGANTRFTNKQEVPPGNDLVIEGEGGKPERPRVEEPIPVNPWLRSMLLEQAMGTKPEPMIDPQALPFDIAKELGLVDRNDEIIKQPVPKFWVENKLKAIASPKGINETTAMIADKVRLGKDKGGLTLGEGLLAYKQATGLDPDKNVISILSGQDRLAYGGERQEKAQEFATKKNKQSYITGLSRMFRSDPLVRAGNEALVGAQRLKTLAYDKDPQGLKRAVNIYLTRTFGDRGQLSNLDASGAAQLEGWLERLNGFVSEVKGEGMTKEQREVYLRIVGGLEQVAEQSIRNYAKDFARSDSAAMELYGIDPMEVAADLIPESLIKGTKEIPSLPPKTEGRVINPESNSLRPSGSKGFKPTDAELKLKTEMTKMNQALKALEASKLPNGKKISIKRQIQADFYERTKKLDPEGKGVAPTREDGSDVP